MSLLDNEKVQEWLIVINDNFRTTKKAWFYGLAASVVLALPLAFGIRQMFYRLDFSSYQPPTVMRPETNIQPLQVIEKKVFDLSNNAYSGFVRIKNINLDWGVPEQAYTVVFKTLGGTTLTSLNGRTFILPASEKLIVFSKFSTVEKPEIMEFTLNESKFLLKPDMVPIELAVSRIEISRHPKELIVAAVVRNGSPFKLRTVHMSGLVYDGSNQVIAVNSTSLNDLDSQETRSFQFYWPREFNQAVRAEIRAEINLFDKNVFETPPGISPF